MGLAKSANTGNLTPAKKRESMAHAVLSTFDANGDGIVTEDEFIHGILPETEEEKNLKVRRERGVVIGVFVKYILTEISDEKAFMSLFATVVNIVAFFTLSSVLLSHNEVFAVQEAVRADFTMNANYAYLPGFAAANLTGKAHGLKEMYDAKFGLTLSEDGFLSTSI